MAEFTAKMGAAVAYYATHRSKTAAYRHAYQCANMKPATVNHEAYELFRHPLVAQAVRCIEAEAAATVKIDAAWVLTQAVELFQRCMQQVKPAFHPNTRRQLKDDDGNALFTFNAAAANRSLEIIGRHVEVAAFKDRLEVSSGLSLEERIQAGRNRAYKASKTEDDEAPATE